LSLLFDLIQKLTLPLDEAQVGLLRGVIENATRTLASGSKSIQHDDAGLHILWESVIGTSMDPQILQRGITPTQNAAAEALASILSKSVQLRKTMQVYLEKSVTLIRGTFPNSADLYSSRGVDTMATLLGSMQFIRKLVEAQPEASKGLPPKYALSREQVIKMAEDSYHLISALMSCIGFGVTAQLHFTNSSARNIFLGSCLKFLEFVLVNSPLELDFEKVQTLWEHFHATGSETDRDTFFHWVQTILVEDAPSVSASSANTSYYGYNKFSGQSAAVTRRRCVTDDAVERLFLRLFHEESPSSPGYPMSALSPLAYAALEKLFRHINGKLAKLSHYTNKVHFVVNVTPLELSGINVLFRAYTQTTDSSLAETISDFLISLQTKLAMSLEKKKVWVLFTKNCMDRIHSFASDGHGHGDPVASRKLHASRMLRLLAKFFHEIASNQSHSYSSSVNGTMAAAASSSLRLSVFWKREGTNSSTHNSIVYMFQKGSVTVGALRARVAKDLKVSPHHLRLMNSGRLILSAKHDEYPLESTGVSSFVDAIILRNPLEDTKHFKANQIRPAVTLAEDPNSEQMFPRKILSDSDTHLSLMFELLSDPSPEVSQSAWDLLDLLPTNSSLLLHMKSLGGVISPETFTVTQANAPRPNWEQLISEGGLLKQRYNLMIISSLLAPLATEFSSEDEIQKSLLWGKHFIHFGGVKYLLQLLLEMQIPPLDSNEVSDRSQHEQSLVLLLQLLSQFLVVSPQQGGDSSAEVRHDLKKFLNLKDLLDEIRPEEIVNQVMALVGRVVEDSLHKLSDGSSAAADGGASSTKTKQMKKRNRAARYEQYFSSAAKNTSSALSVIDTGTEVGDDQKSNKVNPAALVVQYGFSFLASMSGLVPETLGFIQSNEHLGPSLRRSLVESSDDAIRDVMSKGMLSLCRTSLASEGSIFCQLVISSLLSFLEEFFSSQDSLAGGVAGEYFYLFSELLILCPQLPAEDLPPHGDHPSPQDYLREVSIRNLPLVLCELLMRHSPPLGETSEEEDEEDKLLQGLLLVFGAYLDGLSARVEEASLGRGLKKFLGIERGLVLFLFNDCLFSTEKKNIMKGGVVQHSIIPKCKSAKSRDLCFSLLFELAKDSPENCSLLLRLVRPHHSLFRNSSSLIANTAALDSDPVNQIATNASQFLQKHGREMFIPKSKTGYCGLQNPGCICYMNSTIQQLFMIPEFRGKILDVDIRGDDSSGGGGADLSADELQDNVLYQLQLLFAYLQESDKVFVEPDDLCASIKDYEGQPTDVTIQQDASEFVSNFFQQLEGNLMSTRHESLLKEVFGGVFCNELLASGGKRSERLEPFFMISVPVGQGKNSLEEGLKSFIAGETVDYTWESKKDPNGSSSDPKNVIKESLPTTKRTSLRTLPSHLIVHLKRFEFDFETMQQIKINQRYSFPLTLDLYPYTIYGRQDSSTEGAQKSEKDASASESETLSPEDCLYELSGVVVHVGTAHSGHYYSFIKERGGRTNKAKGGSNSSSDNNWFEFNDSFVSEFDVEDLEEECFGGEEKWTSVAGKGIAGGAGRQKVIERSRNAFMLVYDRVQRQPAGGTADGERGEVALAPLAPESFQTVSAGRALIEQIWRDNMAFWRTKSIFNPGYYDFLADLLQASNLLGRGDGDRLLDCQILECAVAFSFGTLTVSHEKERVVMWANWIVEKVLRRFPWCSFHLMNLLCANWTSSNPEDHSPASTRKKFKGHPLRVVLLDVDDAEVRAAVMKVIVVGMEVMLHSNRESYSSGIATLTDSSVAEENSVAVATTGWRKRVNEDPRVTCLEFVTELVSLTRIAQLTWRNIGVFFLPIAVLAKHSTRAKAAMQNRNFLAILLSFFLGVDTPYPALVGGAEPGNHKSRAMTDGYSSPDFSSLLKALLALLPTRRLADPAVEGNRNRGRSMSSETENWIRGIEGQSPALSGGPSDPSNLGKYCDTLTEEAREMITSQVFFYRSLPPPPLLLPSPLPPSLWSFRLLKLGRSVDKILPFFTCALSESEATSKVPSNSLHSSSLLTAPSPPPAGLC
jgi:ubiquitin C-terminal hydrolase